MRLPLPDRFLAVLAHSHTISYKAQAGRKTNAIAVTTDLLHQPGKLRSCGVDTHRPDDSWDVSAKTAKQLEARTTHTSVTFTPYFSSTNLEPSLCSNTTKASRAILRASSWVESSGILLPD